MLEVIGMYKYPELVFGYEMYFRDKRGFKHSINIYDGYGVKDFYMCSQAPSMTPEEYKALPDLIEVVEA